jgi:hypothetical protein
LKQSTQRVGLKKATLNQREGCLIGYLLHLSVWSLDVVSSSAAAPSDEDEAVPLRERERPCEPNSDSGAGPFMPVKDARVRVACTSAWAVANLWSRAISAFFAASSCAMSCLAKKFSRMRGSICLRLPNDSHVSSILSCAPHRVASKRP